MPATGGSTSTGAPTFTQIYSSIISANCIPCHSTGTGASSGMLNMGTKAMAYADLVSVMAAGSGCGTSGLLRVNPGSASTSVLWEKLNKKVNPSSTVCGSGMPLSSTVLTQTQVDEIAVWINAGAMND
jgi:hypothetical protein